MFGEACEEDKLEDSLEHIQTKQWLIEERQL